MSNKPSSTPMAVRAFKAAAGHSQRPVAALAAIAFLGVLAYWWHLFANGQSLALLGRLVVETSQGPQYLQGLSASDRLIELLHAGFSNSASALNLQILLSFVALTVVIPGVLVGCFRAKWAARQSKGRLVLRGLAVAGLSLNAALVWHLAQFGLNQQISRYERSLLSAGFERCGPVAGVAIDGSLRMVELFQLGCSTVELDVGRFDRSPLAYVDVQKTANLMGLVEPLTVCSTKGAYEGPSADGVLEIPLCHAKGGPPPELAQSVRLAVDCAEMLNH